MIVVETITDFKANLQHYLNQMTAGEKIILKDHNTPFAQLQPYEWINGFADQFQGIPKLKAGCLADQILWVSDDFDAPLNQADLGDWENEN